MERNVLPAEAVASELNAHFIESRLHTDQTDVPEMAEVFRDLQNELTKSFAAPTYVVYDPVGEQVLGVHKGVMSAAAFLDFLQESRAKLN